MTSTVHQAGEQQGAQSPALKLYQISVEEAVARMESDAMLGINEAEAKLRRIKFGLNELEQEKKELIFLRFFDQFRDLLIVVLIVAALLAFYLGDFRGGTILLVIVMVNAGIGFYQEYKAEKILESLKQVIRSKAIVIRDGRKTEIDQSQLVPGDLVYLEEGGVVPADIRLTETVNFSTNDFVLTGESQPQEKFADLVIDKEAALSDQDNLVFMGLTVAKGHAHGIVYATGMNTAIGQIALRTETIEHDLSPLQREINSLAGTLTRIAGVIALILFVLNFFVNVGNSENLRLTIELSVLFAISVAAACVPQGLPAQISVALSLGVRRLAQKNAVVKKLSSVETLGSTTVICSDKTGTITKNEMTITHCVTIRQCDDQGCLTDTYTVTGKGYQPFGEVTENNQKIDQHTFEKLKQFFEDGFLASNGRVMPPDSEHTDWYAIGDPSEAAFTPLVMKAGLDPADLEQGFPIIKELPFDSNRRRMTIVRAHKGKQIAYMKGAIESVLDACHRVKLEDEIVPLSAKLQQAILAAADEHSRAALRIIALAYRDFDNSINEYSVTESEREFIFAGFVAMIDPPRDGVLEAIQNVYRGGMRVVMITGDNEVTAKAIAERIGLQADHGELKAYSGEAINGFTDTELSDILRLRSVIFSRVSPEDKYRIVSILKEMGEVVAVTGDGVNDTLSLKKSDIGVAMGKMGSEVAKEAANIVLLDDNFQTLTTAVTEGRNIFANLRKTVLASITSNNGELTCVLLGFVGMAFGLPAPITAVQILAIDLVGEMLPLTAIAFDPADKSLADKPPRKIGNHIVNKDSLINLLFYGFWMGAIGYFSFFMVLTYGSGSLESSRSAAYTGIILCQFVNILSRRTETSIFHSHPFTNPYLWGSFLVSLLLISMLIYIPEVSIWFGFGSLTPLDLSFPIIGALAFLMIHEAGKKLDLFRA